MKLFHKLTFLSGSEFGYFADTCNRALRNSGSHSAYQIEDDVSLTYWHEGERITVRQRDLKDLLGTLNSTCSALNRAFGEITTLWVEEKIDAALTSMEDAKHRAH